LPCVVDVRHEESVSEAVDNAVKQFGGLDILINNASAISLTGTLETPMKKYDLMNQINARGTYMTSRVCLPYLLKGVNPHILNISPPLNMKPRWFGNHVAYTMAKYGMSMCVLGMAEEFQGRVGVNALWPRTAIITAAMEMLGGKDIDTSCRKPEIMADAAYIMLCRDGASYTGHFAVDDAVLHEEGVTNFDSYAVDPKAALMPDFFLDEFDSFGAGGVTSDAIPAPPKEEPVQQAAPGGPVEQVFTQLESLLSPELCERVRAVYAFEVSGDEPGTWYIDLKHAPGAIGAGAPPGGADATFRLNDKNFIKLFNGQLKAANAFMTGRLKISGDMGKALKLEKLMGKMAAKL